MRWARLALPALAALSAPTRAEAAGFPDDRDRALPCRPTIACTAELTTPGTFEVEAGYNYQRTSTGATLRSSPFLLKLTFATWGQLQVGSNGYVAAQGDLPARFLDNVTLGLKFLLFGQRGARPALALSGALSVPTWEGQAGYTRLVDALFSAYASKDVGPIHADLNVGLNLFRLEGRPLSQEFVALALSADLVSPFGVMAEGYVFSGAESASARDGGFLFALSHAPRRWLMFDVGGNVGFFPAERAYSVFVGLTVVPAVLWR